MRTILVTGGTGLVGNAIKTISNNYDYKFIFLSSKDCDLTSYTNTLYTFSSYNPDYVIHLAACVGGLFKNMTSKVDMFEKNILINTNVLKVCHEIKVKKLISCLSTCIFPDKTECEEWKFYRGKCGQEWSYCTLKSYDLKNLTNNEGWGEGAICINKTTKEEVGNVFDLITSNPLINPNNSTESKFNWFWIIIPVIILLIILYLIKYKRKY